mmetsp:Transcript_20325/g.17595  ORF Transcript_20325/g.17595 Transcript_20325/m.17595 type:complete len:206 (+) Transcript_20325:236-853(+)
MALSARGTLDFGVYNSSTASTKAFWSFEFKLTGLSLSSLFMIITEAIESVAQVKSVMTPGVLFPLDEAKKARNIGNSVIAKFWTAFTNPRAVPTIRSGTRKTKTGQRTVPKMEYPNPIIMRAMIGGRNNKPKYPPIRATAERYIKLILCPKLSAKYPNSGKHAEDISNGMLKILPIDSILVSTLMDESLAQVSNKYPLATIFKGR